MKIKYFNALMLMVFLLGLMGCTATDTIARNKVADDFYNEMKTRISEADEIQIHVWEYAENPEDTQLIFEKSYTKENSEKQFANLMSGIKKASKRGTIAKSIPENKIMFLIKDEVIYELNYCLGDRRITDGIERNGVTGVLFLPKSTDEYLK